MGKFTKISQDAFEGMQLDAGVLLKNFDPSSPVEPADSDIVCATTGGIKVDCVATFSDMGEDVDNCPNNMKELKHLDSWDCKMGFTALSTSPSGIKLSLGCADVTDATTPTKIVPRRDLKQSDFSDLWWVGDKVDGGAVAIKLKNALSDSGFSLQTTKNGKGQVSCSLTGHVSIDAQKEMPMEFYVIEAEDAALSVEIDRARASIEVDGTVTLTATASQDGATIAWASSNTGVATVSSGVVTGVAEGICVITATATKNSESAIATCIVTVTPAEDNDAEG